MKNSSIYKTVQGFNARLWCLC